MTNFANIGTLFFGTYDTDLARGWSGDKTSMKIIEKGGIDGLTFKKGQLHGIGNMLGLTDDKITEILSKEKNAAKRLDALMTEAKVNKSNISNTLEQNLIKKYGISKATDFRNISYMTRFKTNFEIAKKNDIIYRLLKGEKDVFKGFGQEITKAGAGKTGVKKLMAQSGKVLGKSMPLIGAALTLGFEIPAVFKSFKDYGTEEGLKQTGRAAFNLAGFAAGAAAGAAIGSAVPILGNIVGGIVGGMIGAFAGKTLLGKSKVEEQSEIEALGIDKNQAKELVKQGAKPEELKAQMAQQQQKQIAQTNPFQQQTYAPQFQGGMPAMTGNISLGDENMMSNMKSAYNMYQFAA